MYNNILLLKVSKNISCFFNQIGDTPGKAYGSVLNIDCKDIEYPANGDCTFGWLFYNGTDWDLDRTITIYCKGSFFIKHYTNTQRD